MSATGGRVAAGSPPSLVARCREGDDAAWGELVHRYSRYVAAIARSHRLADADGEDVFQDVFLRTWRNLDRIADDGALKAWIGQVARNACIDKIRAGRRSTPDSDVVEASDGHAPDAFAELELALDVHGALATLSGDCQEVVDAFFCRDQSYVQISEELGIPAGTIASRISRCLGKLRERLAPAAG